MGCNLRAGSLTHIFKALGSALGAECKIQVCYVSARATLPSSPVFSAVVCSGSKSGSWNWEQDKVTSDAGKNPSVNLPNSLRHRVDRLKLLPGGAGPVQSAGSGDRCWDFPSWNTRRVLALLPRLHCLGWAAELPSRGCSRLRKVANGSWV